MDHAGAGSKQVANINMHTLTILTCTQRAPGPTLTKLMFTLKPRRLPTLWKMAFETHIWHQLFPPQSTHTQTLNVSVANTKPHIHGRDKRLHLLNPEQMAGAATATATHTT